MEGSKTQNPIEKWSQNKNSNNSLRKDIKMALNHVKKCSASLIREIQVEMTLVYSFSPFRLAKIKKLDNHFPGGAVGKQELL